MKRALCAVAAVGALLAATSAAETAYAQKRGGVLKIYFFDSPASMSIHLGAIRSEELRAIEGFVEERGVQCTISAMASCVM